MDITEGRRGSILVFGVTGRLDATTSKMLEEKLLATIDTGERQLVVDFSHLDYISSSGLRLLLLVAKRLSSVNGKIVFCCMQDYVRQVFDMAGFSSIFSIFNSQEDAIKSV